MTTNHEFERQLSAWLRDDSASRVPEHLEQVLVHTIATRQRRWWSSPRRWLPMDLTAPRVWALRPASLRTIVVLAIVALLVAAVVAIVVGSRRPLPPPYGLAVNGELITSADGDIFLVDRSTGQNRPLITGSTFDFGPIFSRDGTRFAFLRGAPTPCGKSDCGLILVVANADGSGLKEITPGEPGLDAMDWSPDGRRIAFLSSSADKPGHDLNLVNVDGTGLTTLATGRPVNSISWLPPDGREIVFRGEHLLDSDPPVGIFAVRPEDGALRQVSTRPAVDADDYQDIGIAPDGTRLVYRETGLRQLFQIHVLDLHTDADRVIPGPADDPAQTGAVWSPDGRTLLYLRFIADNDTVNIFQLVVAPADGSTTGIPLGPRAPLGQDGPTINNSGFSPDGTTVFANYDAEKVARLLPVDGTPGVVIARGELAFPAYQRLAP